MTVLERKLPLFSCQPLGVVIMDSYFPETISLSQPPARKEPSCC